MSARRKAREQVPCPHCGEYIPTDSNFCRHCGSDRQTGWADNDEIAYQAVELPEDEDFTPDKDAPRASNAWTRRGAYLGLVAMAILVGILTLIFMALSRGC